MKWKINRKNRRVETTTSEVCRLGPLGDISFADVDSQHCEGLDQPQSFLKARNDPQIILKLTSNEKHRHNHIIAKPAHDTGWRPIEDRSEISERPILSDRCIVFSERSIFTVPPHTCLYSTPIFWPTIIGGFTLKPYLVRKIISFFVSPFCPCSWHPCLNWMSPPPPPPPSGWGNCGTQCLDLNPSKSS